MEAPDKFRTVACRTWGAIPTGLSGLGFTAQRCTTMSPRSTANPAVPYLMQDLMINTSPLQPIPPLLSASPALDTPVPPHNLTSASALGLICCPAPRGVGPTSPQGGCRSEWRCMTSMQPYPEWCRAAGTWPSVTASRTAFLISLPCSVSQLRFCSRSCLVASPTGSPVRSRSPPRAKRHMEGELS